MGMYVLINLSKYESVSILLLNLIAILGLIMGMLMLIAAFKSSYKVSPVNILCGMSLIEVM